MSLTKVTYSMINASPVNVRDFGAVGDGNTNDTAAIQAAVDYAIANKHSLYIPRGIDGATKSYLITSAITISGPLKIYGDGMMSGLLCDACGAISINSGVTDVMIQDLYFGHAIRYSTTPNSDDAIAINGLVSSHCERITVQNVFADGFRWAVNANYTWSSLFSYLCCVFTFGGVYARGLSVNDIVENCILSGCNAADSSGVLVGDGTHSIEGWLISDSVLTNFAVGVQGLGASNCLARGNIIDFFQQYGVALISTTNDAAANWTVTDNYIATDNVSGASSGIRLYNNFAAGVAQYRGSVISGNDILTYSGADLSYGIVQDGAYERNNIITNNRVSGGISGYACYVKTGTNTIVTNNRWRNGAFYSDVAVTVYEGNIGSVGSSAGLLSQTNGKTKIYFGTTPPGSGDYVQGDIMWNTLPTSGNPPGWVCVSSGTPGTWKAMANLA